MSGAGSRLKSRIQRVNTGLIVGRSLQEVARIPCSDPRRLYREDGSLKRPDEWDDDFGRSRKKSHCLDV